MPADAFLSIGAGSRFFSKDGRPFFWLGDTIWPLFSLYTREEAQYYLECRRRQGFTVEHVMLPFDGGPGLVAPDCNEEGEPLWLDSNPATPNDRFFRKVDEIIRLAREQGMVLVILPCGGSGGSYVKVKNIITKDNVRAYGRWLGDRYRDEPNIVWANGFDLEPTEYEEIARELAAGLVEGDGGSHLICYHPGGSGMMTSGYFHHEKWLAANFIQTWRSYWKAHPLVYADYHRQPPKPVVMVEGAYEAGVEYFTEPVSTLIVRREAYWSFLAGGFHTYGHNDIWRKNAGWRESIDAPGAHQLGILKGLLTSRNWWELVPDQSIFTAGEGSGETTNAAARSRHGDWCIVYLSSGTTVSIDMGKITAGKTAQAEWVDPCTGEHTPLGRFPAAGRRSFSTPAAWEDAVLLLTAESPASR